MFLGQDLKRISLTKGYNILLEPRKDDSLYIGPASLIIPYAGLNTFHSILGITPANSIIYNTNSFLVDTNFIKNKKGLISYDTTHTIFRRLHATYNYLVKNKEEITVSGDMFLLVNPFSASNIGHDLSILFDRIYYYKRNGYTMPVVVGDVMNLIPRSLEICKLLLPTTEFFFLPSDKIVKFNKLYVTPNVIFDICRHRNTVIADIIRTIVSETPHDRIELFKNKKIIIMKTNLNNQVVTTSTTFKCSNAINELVTKHEYIYINPEKMPMNEIILYLYHAKQIVTSFGAISYAHAIFFNPTIKYHFIKTEFNPYYDIEKNIIIKMPLNIDDNISVFVHALLI